MDILLAQRKGLSRVDDELEFFLNNRSAVVVVDASVLPFLRHSWEELGAAKARQASLPWLPAGKYDRP